MTSDLARVLLLIAGCYFAIAANIHQPVDAPMTWASAACFVMVFVVRDRRRA